MISSHVRWQQVHGYDGNYSIRFGRRIWLLTTDRRARPPSRTRRRCNHLVKWQLGRP